MQVAVRAIPDLRELADPEKIKAFDNFIQPNLDGANAIEVTDNDSRANAQIYALAIKPFAKAWDRGRKDIKKALAQEVDNRLKPTQARMDAALAHVDTEMRGYDEKLRQEAARLQRQADEERRKAEAELERRRKIQEARVEQGAEKRTEIPTEVERVEIAAPSAIQMDKRTRYIVKYRKETVDIDKLPDEFIIKTPHYAKIQDMAIALNKDIPENRKGVDDIPQKIPGVEFYWATSYRNA